jgi:hypothetical protein
VFGASHSLPIAAKLITVRESQEPVVDSPFGEEAAQSPDEETAAGIALKDFLNRVTVFLAFIQSFRQRFSFHVFAPGAWLQEEVPYQDVLALEELRWCYENHFVLVLASS